MERRPRATIHRKHPSVQRTAHTARARVQRRHHPHSCDYVPVGLRHRLPRHGGNARFLRIGIMADKRRKQRLGINPLHRQHPCVQQRRQSRRRYRLHIRRNRRRQCSALWFVAGYRNRRFAMTEAAAILEKLNQIQQTQQKSWLAALTEKSAPAHTPASSPPQNKSAPHHHPTPCACATVPPQASPAAA